MSLDDLGLTDQEQSVYRRLLEQPIGETVTPDRLREELHGELDGDPGAALTLLTRCGLIDGDDRRGYFAAPPALALGAELAAHRDRLSRAELAVAELVESYRNGSLNRASRDLVEVVEGREAIGHRVLQLQLAARQRVDSFVTGEVTAVGPDETEESTVLGRGLRVRVAIDHDFLDSEGAADNIEESLERGIEVRTVELVPGKLIVCDSEVALMPLAGPGGSGEPSVVLRGGLARLAQELFDSVWVRGTPFGRPTSLDDLDVRILRLLMLGMTDAAVAGNLDLSSRTVQRRIQALMNRAGVSTRIQLGWHVRHHHWT